MMKARAFLVSLSVVAAGSMAAQPIIEYGRQCAALIAKLEPFDCRKGAILPITVNGKTPEKYFQEMTCDRPAMAPLTDFPCAPYSRALLLRDDTVQASAYCRQKSLRTPDSPFYEEIDVILHSRINGATCWFSAIAPSPDKPKDGSRVPPPTEPGAEKFWDPPEQTVSLNCVSCHDSDPWMYSPLIGQTNQYPNDPFGYYTNAIGPFKKWLQPHGITTRGNNCTSCHRIGNMDTCKTIALQSVGRHPINGTDEWAKTYPHSHWMPLSNSLTLRQWEVTYDTAMREIERCCHDPKAPGCEIVPIAGK